MNKWLLFFSVLLIFTNINVSAKNEPSVSISVDKDMILKDGGVAIVTVQLSENFKGKAPVVELKYETNGTGAMNYDFTMSPAIYYKKFGKNETSFSFAITGIYQQWGSSKVDLNITLYNIKNATPSSPVISPSGDKVEGDVVDAGDHKIIDKSLMDHYAKNMDDIYKNIGIVEVKKGNILEGFRISFIRKGSPFAKLGVKRGDIIKAINGQKIDSYNAAFGVYKNISNIDNLTLVIQRGKEEMELEYEVN